MTAAELSQLLALGAEAQSLADERAAMAHRLGLTERQAAGLDPVAATADGPVFLDPIRDDPAAWYAGPDYGTPAGSRPTVPGPGWLAPGAVDPAADPVDPADPAEPF